MSIANTINTLKAKLNPFDVLQIAAVGLCSAVTLYYFATVD